MHIYRGTERAPLTTQASSVPDDAFIRLYTSIYAL